MATLSPRRRAVVAKFTGLDSGEQARLIGLSKSSGLDLWDYLEKKWAGSITFSSAPAAPPTARRSGLRADLEALSVRPVAEAAALTAATSADCSRLSEQLQRARRSA